MADVWDDGTESKVLFDKKYSDEALYDLERDIYEAICEGENIPSTIPKDKHGFRKGTFHVTIVWRDEE